MPFSFFQRRTVTPSVTKDKKEKIPQKLSFADKRSNSNDIIDLQSSVDNSDNTQSITQLQEKIDNNTGMPDELKDGVENLSGEDMSDVKVTYNSDKPAKLNAHAYSSGNDIHIGPGQEKHLPHEAWHVVQQKQNRVKPIKKADSGIPINDDPALEKEADQMGQKAIQLKSTGKLELNTRNSQTNIIQKVKKKGNNTVHGFDSKNKSDGSMIDTLKKEGAKKEEERKEAMSGENKQRLENKRARVKKASEEGTDLGGSNSTLIAGLSIEQEETSKPPKKKNEAAIAGMKNAGNLGEGINSVADAYAGESGSLGINHLLSKDGFSKTTEDNEGNQTHDYTGVYDPKVFGLSGQPVVLSGEGDAHLMVAIQNTEFISKMFSGLIGLSDIMSGKTPLKFKSLEEFQKLLGSLESIAKGAEGVLQTINFAGKDANKEASGNDTPITEGFTAFKNLVGVIKGFVDFIVKTKELIEVWKNEEDSAKKKELGVEIGKAMAKIGSDGVELAGKINNLINYFTAGETTFADQIPFVGAIMNVLKNALQMVQDGVKIHRDHKSVKEINDELDKIQLKWKISLNSDQKDMPSLTNLANVERIKKADEINKAKFGDKSETKGTEKKEYKDGLDKIQTLDDTQLQILKDAETLIEINQAAHKRLFNEYFRIATSAIKIVGNAMKLVPEANTQIAGIGLSGAAAAADAGKSAGAAAKQYARDKAADPKSTLTGGTVARGLKADTSKTTDAKAAWRMEQVQNIHNKVITLGNSIKNDREKHKAFISKDSNPELKLLSTMLKGVNISDQTCTKLAQESDASSTLTKALYDGLKER